MSASSKKKLRSAENAEKLTERQRTERQEAKKLKLYTTLFVVVIALMAVIAVWSMISNTIKSSGVKERGTVAVTVGSHDLSNAELNYFYIDAVNNFYSTYGEYAAMFGLDLTKPLDEQVTDEETGSTWADDFLSSAIDNATAVYALVDEANAQGYTLSASELAEVENNMSYMTLYASAYGYSDVNSYVKAMYGNGASEEGLREYYKLTYLADSFYNNYCASLTYDESDLRAAEAENYDLYSSFSYNYYNLPVSKFYEGGTTDSEGNTTYSDEEIAAAEAACKAAAEELANGTYATVEDFNAAIANLSINAEAESATSVVCTDYAYSNVNSVYIDWLADDARAAGDVAMFANTTHSHAEGEEHSDDEDSAEYETLNGYYVVYAGQVNDNSYPLANVRHILVSFEGGTSDDSGNVTYSDEEIAIAKAAAEDLLADWESGDATEDSFAALANEHSDDGDGTTGGLYEDVYPGQMVTNFNDWCFAEGRKAGDTGIVESEYGFHVMYYSGDSETTFRDYQITQELTSADSEAWYSELLDAMEVTRKEIKYISTDLVLNAG